MPKKLKVIVDTNVIISAVIGTGPISRQIFSAFIAGDFTPIVSNELLKEIHDVAKKPKLKKYFFADNIKRLKALIDTDAIKVTPTKNVRVCRDAKDNFILEIALEARPDFVITNDPDLLVLDPFENIPIILAKRFVEILKIK